MPEHCDALHRHLAQGLPFSAIAKAINLKFKTAYTRNDELGRAKRMGLVGSDRSERLLKAAPSRLERLIKPRPVKTGSAAPRRPATILKAQKPPRLRCAEVEPRHVSLIELERGDCRYPYGGDEEGGGHHLLRSPTLRRSSYCSPHFDLNRNVVALSEPKVSDNVIRPHMMETT